MTTTDMHTHVSQSQPLPSTMLKCRRKPTQVKMASIPGAAESQLFFYMTQSLSRKRVLFSCRVPVRGQAEGNESGHASKALTDYRGTCAKHCFNSGRRDMSSRRTQCLTGKPGAVGELQIGFGQRLRLGKSKWRCCFRLRAGNEDESTRNGKENKAVVGQAHTKLIPTQHQA